MPTEESSRSSSEGKINIRATSVYVCNWCVHVHTCIKFWLNLLF